MIEFETDLATRDGRMGIFVSHPDRQLPAPAVILYMDAVGIREELREMARRLASMGYCAVLPDLFYRNGPKVNFAAGIPERGTAGWERVISLVDGLSNAAVMSDTEAIIGFLDAADFADHGPMGCVGYCMSGQFALSAAAHFNDRIAAAASIYGVKLATDDANSPHGLAGHMRGELYIAAAEHDLHVPPDMFPALETALDQAGARYEIEFYPGTEHGFAFPDRPCYHPRAAATHWERLGSLFDRTLKHPRR